MTEIRHFVKFADDTVIVSLLNNKETSHLIIDHFVTWCQDAFLELNAFNTKDMCIDYCIIAMALTLTKLV